jgi:hypothetical protein
MLEFLDEVVAGCSREMPLYYCKLGIVELEAGFLLQILSYLTFLPAV